MRALHNTYFTDKSPRAYIDTRQLDELIQLSKSAGVLYDHYSLAQPDRPLAIVDRYVAEVRAIAPDYVGFSLNRMPKPVMRRVITAVRAELDLPIIFGGWITPFLTDLQKHKLLSVSPRDCLIARLADNSLPDLLEVLEHGGDPVSVSGVFQLREGALAGWPAETQPELGALPFPDFSQYDLNAFAGPTLVLPMQTARGRSWRKCTFCAHSAIYQGEEVDRVVDTIRHLRERYGCRQVIFHDEELPAKRPELLSDALLNEKIDDVYLYTYARLVKQFEDPALLGKMYCAGFRALVWGMESGNQRVLDLMMKGTEPKQMGRILKLAAARGFGNLIFVMFGFPGETRAEAQDTVDFLVEHSDEISFAMSGVFQMIPGTPVAHAPSMWGVSVNDDGDWRASDGMTRDEAENFYEHFRGRVKMGLQTTNKLSYFIRENIARMILFACFTNGIIPPDEGLQVLATREADAIYPLIIGRLEGPDESTGSQMSLSPVNAGQSHIFNQLRPAKPIPIDELGQKIHALADGRRSLAEILVELDLGPAQYEAANAFVSDMLARGNAYLLTSPWSFRSQAIDVPTDHARLTQQDPEHQDRLERIAVQAGTLPVHPLSIRPLTVRPLPVRRALLVEGGQAFLGVVQFDDVANGLDHALDIAAVVVVIGPHESVPSPLHDRR
jgi:radical SAM superfamily enzyme YgiQ (UPF0313 family)